MSFTDDENKRIEDEEIKAEQEIRARFQTMFQNEEQKPARTETTERSGRVIKKVSFDVLSDDEPVAKNGRKPASADEPVAKNGRRTASSEVKTERKPETEKRRIIEKKETSDKRKAAEKKKTADRKKTAEKQKASDSQRVIEKQRPAERPVRPEASKSPAGKVRITGPGYSMSGHKILTDSNYEEVMDPRREYRKTDTPTTCFVAPGIQWFRQDIIPPAVNEYTRGAVINDTRKVRKRSGRVEKSAPGETRETVKKAQVSVFSAELRTETSTVPADYMPLPNENVVAKGRVNPNTARISRDVINKMLEDAEKGKLSEDQRAAVIPEADRQRAVSQRRSSQQRKQQSHLKSIDNSKKSQKQRQKRSKTHGPGGKIAVIVLLLLAAAICVFGYIGARNVFDDSAMNPEDLSKIEYTVYEGTTDAEVAEFLVSKGLVESELMYKVRAKIFDAEYEAGTYELSPSYSTEKIINILSGFDYSSSGS